ncbi:carboxypeptidase regulatory-like domain-containing protein [Pyxidicoccus xibeiensis]|uniref:carboxypeptidase regulatory-like domain-containing protein n=1 Tax=Pyxidicoccus xibeiensis TaxID=2906759 RepID=UPI0020A6EE2C|nr:carboxypeptidase regulatory-like domain-containing protein [Pyxidicoccus xibeiensis]MCP3136904.1 carboxypeptidase-like regulatory domain-containing protein [Pyxidicoccus xibeiensis]
MRTRAWGIGLIVIVALVLLGGCLLLRGDVRTAEPDPARAARPTSAKPLNLPSTPPRSPQPGAHLRIRGTVVDLHGAPVAGAHVSASWPEPGQTLSELPCPVPPMSDWPDGRYLSFQGKKLPRCEDLAWNLIIELITAREGEAPVHAQTTTAADGTFVLENLPEGPQALWVLAEHGAMMRSGIPAGTEDVELVLTEAGRMVSGLVLGDGAPLAGASVTVFDLNHTRFFDAITDAEGRFHLGPLPWGADRAVVSSKGWLPRYALVDTDRKLELHRPRTLSGRVLSGGAPVPGVEVRMRPGNFIPGLENLKTPSDAQGRFSFVLSSEYGSHTLSASHAGRYAIGRVEAGASAPPEVVLELGTAMGVEGQVSDDARRPVAGARVTLRAADSASILETVTDARGHYQLGPVEPGTWDFSLKADGYVDVFSAGKRTLSQGMGPVDFTLDPASSISGSAVDSAGRPIPGLKLTLESQEATWTDEDGRFLLDAKAPGRYHIRVSDKRFLSGRATVQAPSKDIRLVVREGASVKGTVVDARGLPLQGFHVELQPPEQAVTEYRLQRETTDGQGRFHLKGFPPGRYVLLASKETAGTIRRVWREVELGSSAHPDVELRLDAERTLSGTVVDGEGTPLEDVYVRARTPQQGAPHWKQEGRTSHNRTAPFGTPTGPDGRFTLLHLTEAAYDVSLWKSGYTVDPERSTGARLVEEGLFRVGPDTGPLHFVLARKPHAVGRVVGPDGAPLSDFSMSPIWAEISEGTFAYPIDGEGPLTLHFKAKGMATVVRVVEQRTRGPDVDLGVVRMAPGPTLHGRVIDAETSAPVEDAFITLSTRDGTQLPEEAVPSAKDGSFTLENVSAEATVLVVSASDRYRVQRVPVDSVQGALTVRLDPGARVEVTVKDGQGRLRAASVLFHRDSEVPEVRADAPEGRLVQRGLEPGTYTVRVDPEEVRRGKTPVFHPQRVSVPASGVVQVAFTE